MEAYQQRFHDYLMSMVTPGNESTAEEILARCFGDQNAGEFTQDALQKAVAELTPLLTPESADKLQKSADAMTRKAEW